MEMLQGHGPFAEFALLLLVSAVAGAISVRLRQPVLIAGFLVYPGVGVMGVVFTAVWVLIAYLRAEVLSRQRRGRAQRG